MHPVLRRQLKRIGIVDEQTLPDAEQWARLLHVLCDTYTAYDSDRYTLERSLDISSREMQELYADLERNSRTQLSKERDRLRAIISNIGDGMCFLDADGTISLANPAAREMLGYRVDEIAQQNIGAHLPPADLARLRLLADSADSNDTLRVEHCAFTRRDGSTLPVSYVVTKQIFGGELQGLVLLFRDMTEQLKTIQTLHAAREEAEQASRAKSEFLSSMSHELRTPMNAVLGFAQLLEYENLAEGQLEHVREILKAGAHLLELINRILDLAKIESGKLDLRLDAIPLGPVIEECRSMVRKYPSRHELTFVFPPKVELTVVADRTRLKQCLLNLLSNAIKYNRAHGRVMLSVFNDTDSVHITVSDTGTGIPREKLDEIFHAFSRINEDMTNVEGTGIGLTITRQLIELMGGSIEVVSEPGVGSTFTITLRLATN